MKKTIMIPEALGTAYEAVRYCSEQMKAVIEERKAQSAEIDVRFEFLTTLDKKFIFQMFMREKKSDRKLLLVNVSIINAAGVLMTPSYISDDVNVHFGSTGIYTNGPVRGILEEIANGNMKGFLVENLDSLIYVFDHQPWVVNDKRF